MDYTIYYDGLAVDHVTARTLESAQQHADASHSRPVVAVPSEGDEGMIAAARYQSRLLAAKVTERIDMIAEQYATAILAGLGGHREGVGEAVTRDIRAALHLFRQSSNSGLAAALREIAGLEGPAKVIAERALEVGGVR